MNIVLKASGYYEVSFRYHPKLVTGIKQIPGSRFNGSTKTWTVPATNQVELERFTRQAKYYTEVVWGQPQQTEEDIAYTLPEMDKLTVNHGLKIEPYPYQLEGIAQGLKLKRFLNGDDPGLGKTMQSIATVNLANAFPCLVICPSSLKINWEREWNKFTDKKAMILTDAVKDTWPFFWQTGMNQIFITNYESLKKYFVQKINKSSKLTLKDIEFRQTINLFKSVIIDESHRCKSTATQQSKFTKGICTGKEYILLLSGTPVINKPKDLVSQLGIMDQMGAVGGYKNFVTRYCSGQKEASNLKELNYRLWNSCFFRREKSKVLTDLPDKVRQVLNIDITNRKEYIDAENDLIQYLIRYKNATDEKLEAAIRGQVMVQISILRNISARGKIKEVIEFVKDFIENDQKIILFVHLKEVAMALIDAFPKAVTVTGSNTQQEKQQSVDKFQNDPNTKIIICSIKAAGVGLTLTASSNVAFVEFPWTYADCVQCEDRAHRIGQKDSVTCYYFLGEKTIDERVYQIIQDKKDIANAVTGSEDAVQTNMVDMVANIFNDRLK